MCYRLRTTVISWFSLQRFLCAWPGKCGFVGCHKPAANVRRLISIQCYLYLDSHGWVSGAGIRSRFVCRQLGGDGSRAASILSPVAYAAGAPALIAAICNLFVIQLKFLVPIVNISYTRLYLVDLASRLGLSSFPGFPFFAAHAVRKPIP
jgi:hypothetical protein